MRGFGAVGLETRLWSLLKGNCSFSGWNEQSQRISSYGGLPPMTVDLETALRAMLKTPPPPAGDPSTLKKKAKKAKKKR